MMYEVYRMISYVSYMYLWAMMHDDVRELYYDV